MELFKKPGLLPAKVLSVIRKISRYKGNIFNGLKFVIISLYNKNDIKYKYKYNYDLKEYTKKIFKHEKMIQI